MDNRYHTSPDPIEGKVLRRTSFQFDDSFLQTINEWQRRNAAALDSTGSEDTDSDTSDASDLPSPPVFSSEASPVPRLRRTLLSIVAQKRTAELASPETVSRLLYVDALFKHFLSCFRSPISLKRNWRL